ncbi:MAG: flagellar hook-length control protein FliK [Methylococcaceae bacterium]
MGPQNQNLMFPKANQNEAFTQKKQYLVAKKNGGNTMQPKQKPQTKETTPFAKELAKVTTQPEKVKNIGDDPSLTDNLKQEVVDPSSNAISEPTTNELNLPLDQAVAAEEEIAGIIGNELPTGDESFPETPFQESSVLTEIQEQIATMRSQLNDWEERLSDLGQEEDDAELLKPGEYLPNNNNRDISTEVTAFGLAASDIVLDNELQTASGEKPHTKPAFNKGEILQAGQNIRSSSISSQGFDDGNADPNESFHENNKFLFAGLKQQAGQSGTENQEGAASVELTSSQKLNSSGLLSTSSELGEATVEEDFDLQLDQLGQADDSVSNEQKANGLSQTAQTRGSDVKPTSVTINRPMGDLAWKQEFGESIVWLADRAINRAEINVNPPHLGPISIQVDVKQDKASVAFNTQHAVVKEIIESAIPKLKEMLASQQIDLADVNVSQESPNHRSAQEFTSSGQQSSASQTPSDQIDEQGEDLAENAVADTSSVQEGSESINGKSVTKTQGLFDAHA